MPYDPDIHHRRSIRLQTYDYAQPGAYFITLCSHNRECMFGSITSGKMTLSPAGEIVSACWHDLPAHYAHVGLDEFMIMPNHVHGIVILHHPDTVGAGLKPAPTRKRQALPEIVRALKTFSSRRINILRSSPGTPVWQRNYYEHVIRDEGDLHGVRDYIVNNPAGWDRDEENPAARAGLRTVPAVSP